MQNLEYHNQNLTKTPKSNIKWLLVGLSNCTNTQNQHRLVTDLITVLLTLGKTRLGESYCAFANKIKFYFFDQLSIITDAADLNRGRLCLVPLAQVDDTHLCSWLYGCRLLNSNSILLQHPWKFFFKSNACQV